MFASVPQPSVIISSFPGNNTTPFVGLNLTLSCVVMVRPGVDTDVTVRGGWERNGTQLQNSDDARITVNNNFMRIASTNNFQITATIRSIGFSDAGMYRCFADITQQESNVIVPRSLSENQRFISVQGMLLLLLLLHAVFFQILKYIIFSVICRISPSRC